MLKTLFYDKYTEEQLVKKIEGSESKLRAMMCDSENTLTKMVGESLSQFKLELKVAELEKEEMSHHNKRKR